MDHQTLEQLKERQFNWQNDEEFKHYTVREMMVLHRLIEVAEVAPENVILNKEKTDSRREKSVTIS